MSQSRNSDSSKQAKRPSARRAPGARAKASGTNASRVPAPDRSARTPSEPPQGAVERDEPRSPGPSEQKGAATSRPDGGSGAKRSSKNEGGERKPGKRPAAKAARRARPSAFPPPDRSARTPSEPPQGAVERDEPQSSSRANGSAHRPAPRTAPSESEPPDVKPPGVVVGDEDMEAVAQADAPRARRERNGDWPQRGSQERIRDFERHLDQLLHDVDVAAHDAQGRRRAVAAIGEIASRLGSDRPPEDRLADTLVTAREMLTTDYYMRQWGRFAMRCRSERVDDFGLDPAYEKRVRRVLEAIYRHYFRVEARGLENVPAQGPMLLVANHGGALPWDGMMLKTALKLEHPARLDPRWLVEDYLCHAPFLGAFLNRIGAVRACQENAERLLSQDKTVVVFPEGIQGVGKLYRDRYRLQRFGRGGHVKLALRTRTPLIPVAIVGAEEAYPVLSKTTSFSRALGVPFVPITPLFPWLGPLGALPLPSRWRIVIGEPIEELQGLSPEVADDPVRVHRLNERVRSRIQAMVDQALVERGEDVYV